MTTFCFRCSQARCSGACICSISGRDVIEHQTLTGCPLKLFEAGDEGVDPLALVERDITALVYKQPEGAGDSLKALLDKFGADRAAKLFEQLTGVSCGCESRRAWLNKFWPY